MEEIVKEDQELTERKRKEKLIAEGCEVDEEGNPIEKSKPWLGGSVTKMFGFGIVVTTGLMAYLTWHHSRLLSYM